MISKVDNPVEYKESIMEKQIELEGGKLQQSSNVLSWILKEILEKQEDYITIICKDSEKCRVSGLLLAAVSPFLAGALTNNNLEECTIFMPDVEVSSITRIFERIYQIGGGFQDIDISKSKDIDDSLLHCDGKTLMDPFKSIFSTGKENKFGELKSDPEASCQSEVKDEPEEFDLDQAEANMMANKSVLIKRLISNHDQSKVSVLTKFEFDVNPFDFGDDATIENNDGDVLMEEDIEQFIDSEEVESKDKTVIKRKLKKGKKHKRVKCEDCVKEFSPKALDKHIKEVHREQPFKCDVCNQDFFVKSEFEKHIKNSGKCDPLEKAKMEMLQCLECGKQCLDKAELLAHQEDENAGCGGDLPLEDDVNGDADYDGGEGGGEEEAEEFDPVAPRKRGPRAYTNSKGEKTFRCQICKKDFDTIKKRSVHRRRQHVNLTCQTCQQEFILEAELKTHVETEHKAAYAQKFKCDKCPAMFAFPDKLKRHLQIKHSDVVKSYSCHLCSLTSPYLTNIKRHIQKHHGAEGKKKKVICEDCGKSFATQKSLEYKIHMAYHQADKFSCECQMLFDNKKQKVHHMQVVHLKELLGCDKCLYMCMDQSQLNNHEKNTHEVEKPKQVFICDICGAEYKSAGSLKEHKERKHYPKVEHCPHCMKEMPAIDIKRHIRKNHTDSGICNVCGVQAKCLKKHMKSAHTPKHLAKYKCDFCDKGFPYKAGLDRHRMNNHLKLRPFKCRYGCESAFNDSSNRNQHEKKIHGVTFRPKETHIDEIKAE